MLQQPNKTFSDFPMFPSKNSFTRDMRLKTDLASIRQAIKNIVLTRMGERAFDYNFGCSIHHILFENITGIGLDMISYKHRIINNVNQYEPRVVVNEVKITGTDHTIDILIEYSILALHTKDTITISLERTR